MGSIVQCSAEPLPQASGRGGAITRARSNFRERDLRAAIRAAQKAGKVASRVEIDTDGTIRIVLQERSGDPEANEWEEDCK